MHAQILFWYSVFKPEILQLARNDKKSSKVIKTE